MVKNPFHSSLIEVEENVNEIYLPLTWCKVVLVNPHFVEEVQQYLHPPLSQLFSPTSWESRLQSPTQQNIWESILFIIYIVKKKINQFSTWCRTKREIWFNSLLQGAAVKRLKQGTTYLQDTHSECISEYFMCFRVVTISDVCGCDEQLKWVVLFHIKFSAFNFFLELTHSFLSVAWENKQKSM